jgi:polyhydroxybutyrate depolymerase
MRLSHGAVVSCLLLSATACGGQSASPPRNSPVADCRGGEAASFAPSPGSGVSYSTLSIDGRLRDFRLFQPSSIDIAKTVSVVIVLPPPSVDAGTLESVIHFDNEASTGGFLSASPNGCDYSWAYSPGAANAADEDFVRKMIEQLRTRFHVSNVYATSGSGGSRMLYRLACDLADEIVAVADVDGTMILKDGCTPTRPVSILEMHGTADETSPWAGGGPNGSYPVEAVNERWRTLDGCTGDPAVATTGITVSSVWTCQRGTVVRLDKVVGGKHTWFGSGDGDAVPGEPSANSVIWSFFSRLQARA